MLSVMHYIFSSFWIWLGTLLLVLAISRLSLFNWHIHQNINSPTDDHSVDNSETDNG